MEEGSFTTTKVASTKVSGKIIKCTDTEPFSMPVEWWPMRVNGTKMSSMESGKCTTNSKTSLLSRMIMKIWTLTTIG
jgi:hypothetical protein